MAEPFVGMIIQVGFNYAPVGWSTCAGQLIPVQQNAALFSLLGTSFGGNGTTNFALPDLQGRVAVGVGAGAGLSPYIMGQKSGLENVTLSTQQLPAHNHTLSVSSTRASLQLAPGGGALGKSQDGAPNATSLPQIYCPAGALIDVVLSPMSIGMTGGNLPVSIVQPYQAVLNCIAMQGIYPSRP